MLSVDLHDKKTDRHVRVGTVEEFIDKFVKEVGSVTFVMSNGGHTKRAKEALIRIFQRTWDERNK